MSGSSTSSQTLQNSHYFSVSSQRPSFSQPTSVTCNCTQRLRSLVRPRPPRSLVPPTTLRCTVILSREDYCGVYFRLVECVVFMQDVPRDGRDGAVSALFAAESQMLTT